MKHSNFVRRQAALLAAAALALPATALVGREPLRAAQEPLPPVVVPELGATGGATGGATPGAQDPRQELIELFRKVETRLEEIDKLLYDASAGQGSVKDAAKDSGMAKLLESSRSKSSEVISGIDRILEIAKSQGGT